MKTLNAAIILLALTACGKDSKESDKSTKANPNRVSWEAVSQEFNPSIEDMGVDIQGVEKLKVDMFGYNGDVELIYSSAFGANQAQVKLFRVYKESASWGATNARSNGTTLEIQKTGSYQCSIKIQNGQITALKGGCYVRLQIILPLGSEVEVYNAGALISKRFIPVDTKTFLENLDRATWKADKFAVIDDFVASYANTNRRPALFAVDLGKAINEFSFGEEKLEALRRLHPYCPDRENLAKMIEDNFSHFDKPKARAIVGLP